MPEGTVAGLGQPGVEGFEHAGEFEGAQRIAERGVEDAHVGNLLGSDRMTLGDRRIQLRFTRSRGVGVERFGSAQMR